MLTEPPVVNPDAQPDRSQTIWVGTYTGDSGRDGVGIGVLTVSAGGVGGSEPVAPAGAGERVLTGGEPEPALAWAGTASSAPSPSFVAVHPTLPVVYAVGEAAGTLAAFLRTGPHTLESLGEPWAAGEAVCHVAVDPGGRFVTAACWGDGRVLLYDLDAEGRLVSRFEAVAADDPHAGRARADAEQDAPLDGRAPRRSRAHASLMLADGRVMTTDLGYDLVRVWTVVPAAGPGSSSGPGSDSDSGSTLALDHEIALPYNSGPRHLVQHPSGAVLIITEYSVEVVTLEFPAPETPAPEIPAAAEPAAAEPAAALPRFAIASVASATEGGAETGDAGAEITLAPDARFAHVTVRGSNRLTTLRLDDRGRAHPLIDVPTGGDGPRHHRVLPGGPDGPALLLVAHELSNDVALFALDPGTGIPTPHPGSTLPVNAPTALIPAGPDR